MSMKRQPKAEAPTSLSQTLVPSEAPSLRQQSKLYGRSVEQAKLYNCFQSHHEDTTPRLVLLSGPSGIGKTALANTLKHGRQPFCTGKHDQWLGKENEMRHEPYAAWLAALTELAPQIRGKTKDIEQALDNKSQAILLQMVPALKVVLPQSPSGGLDGMNTMASEAMNRFERVVRKFLEASSQDESVIILLDDLQWADSCSLDLMETIVMEVPSVFVVATCRDDQVNSDSPVCETLRRLEDRHASIVNIQLSGLSQDAVQELLQDMDAVSTKSCESVVSLVWSHTEGNVFFVHEFVAFLRDSDLLQLQSNQWEWHAPHGKQLDVLHGDVLQLVQKKVSKLEKETVEVLQVAAAIGSDIVQLILQCVFTFSVNKHLTNATKLGLIQYQSKDIYKFSHDRIQQAVYAMIPEPEAFHLNIGRRILKKLSPLSQKDYEQYIFLVLNQLSRGFHLIDDQVERYQIASLCLLAGRTCAFSSDFRAAAKHLQTGIRLLGDDSHWRSQYALSLDLYNAAAEVGYTVGNLDQTDHLIESVLEHAKRFEDKLTAYSTRILCYGARNRVLDAVNTGLEVLDRLGEPFPTFGRKRHVLVDFLRIKWMLGRKSRESLLRLPFMKAPEKLAAMQLMNLIFLYCYLVRVDLMPLLVLRMFRLTLKHGICAQSAMGFVGYGMLLSTCDQYGEGYEFGQLGLKCMDRFQGGAFHGRVIGLYYAVIHHWKRPVIESLEPLRRGQQIAMETGDIEFGMICASVLVFYLMYARCSLVDLELQLRENLRLMEEYQQETWAGMLRPILQAVHNYMGKSENPLILTGAIADQDVELREAREKHQMGKITAIHMVRMELCYVFGEFELAEQMAKACGNVRTEFAGAYEVVGAFFMQGLTALAMARNPVGKRSRMQTARRIIRQMKIWARSSPHNCLNKSLLLEAEYAAVKGQQDSAVAKFLSSIALASHEGNWFEQAIAEERMGRYLLEQGDEASARSHLQSSHDSYRRWGASAKVKHMEKEMPYLARNHI